MTYPAMISGPDLGGGYLHQLTRQSAGDVESWVFHAQDGGPDAGGPPMGSLAPLGWEHPAVPCQYGGRQCWHREFEVPALSEVRVRAAYNRTRFVFEAMLAQLYRGSEVPYARSFEETVERVGGALDRAGDRWVLDGESALWVRGLATGPREITVRTDPGGVSHAADAIPEYLIEPLAETGWGPDGPTFGARAFVGTMVKGTRLEIGSARGMTAGNGGRPDPASEVPVAVEWSGRRLLATRLEFALGEAVSRGAAGPVVESLRTRLVAEGPDVELLARVLRSAGVAAPTAESVIGSVRRS